MSGPIIETEGLTKKYGNFTAVDSLDLRLEEGEVFGFLGPNGSGKSTTILMILGLTEPTKGWARVSGFDPTRNPLAVKRNIGYLPESVGFYNEPVRPGESAVHGASEQYAARRQQPAHR